MNAYHYSIVRCRDVAMPGELRNVGLLVLSPAQGKAWLRRADVKQKAHLIGDDAAFIRALLDLLATEAKQVAQSREAAVVHGWLRARSLPTEDAIFLSPPALGIAQDLETEVRRLRNLYLGKGRSIVRSRVETFRDSTLRDHGLRDHFVPRRFQSGPATWGFPTVTPDERQPVVLNTLSFDQSKPEGILDAAFRNIGRAGEVSSYHPGVRWITIAAGPGTGKRESAFRRGCRLMEDAGLNVVQPDKDALVTALGRVGLLVNDAAAQA